jgi:hypothetical protein
MLGLPLLVLVSAWLSADSEPPPGQGDPLAQAPAEELPDTVEDCQAMFDRKNDRTWRAADGNVSVELPGGGVAWLFGDTHRAGARFVRNSILVQEGHKLTSTTGGQAIPNDRNGDYYWPTDGLIDGGFLRVFATRVTRVDPVERVGLAPRFENRGVALVNFTFDARGYPIYASKLNITRADEGSGIQWGTAAVNDDGWVYVYGQRKRPDEWIFGRDVYVAQVPAGALDDRADWRFWTGSEWAADQSRAAPIERAESGRFASNFSVDNVDGTWIAVSKHSDIVGDRIIEMRSSSAIGPFVTTSTIPAPSSAQTWTYQAKGHAELPLANGKTLVTWNVGAARPKSMGQDFAKPRCGEH